MLKGIIKDINVPDYVYVDRKNKIWFESKDDTEKRTCKSIKIMDICIIKDFEDIDCYNNKALKNVYDIKRTSRQSLKMDNPKHNKLIEKLKESFGDKEKFDDEIDKIMNYFNKK